MIRVRRALAARTGGSPGGGGHDEGVALLMVIMLMLIVATLGIVITTAVVGQVQPAQFGTKNSQTLYAAETGLQAALSQVRSAAAPPNAQGKVYGAPAALPCTISGAVGSSTGLTYSVGVQYFSSDPSGKDAAWRTANALTCTPGSGLAVSPNYAYLSSHGARAAGVPSLSATAGDRTVSTIYSFSMTNANVSGGLMLTFQGHFCVQADTATVGSTVHYVASANCVHSAPRQTWQWDTDYRIRLTSTIGTPGSGLCLTGGFSGNRAVVLTTCDASRADQLFSYEGGGHFRGQNSGNTGYSNNCLWAGTTYSSLAGATLMSGEGACGSNNDDWGSWAPEPKFGAGAAGVTTHQLVNYAQFGRCFDVTGEDINASFMIIYPCKQDPTGHNGFLWNHQYGWSEPASGSSAPQQITTKPNSVYCLTTPSPGVSPAYPTFKACVSGDTTQQWVRTSAVAGNYAASYTITDSLGRCLSVGPQWSGQPWSTVAVATCTGGPEQKWDAPPNAVDASVTNTREGVGG